MPGAELICEIKDSDDSQCYRALSDSLNGDLVRNSLLFDNNKISGEIIKKVADKGLVISKWKCLPSFPLCVRKLAAEIAEEKKFILLYFLNPARFNIRNGRKFHIKGSRNNIFLTNESTLEFYLLPKQEFYLFEISFSRAWLVEQLKTADTSVKETINRYIDTNRRTFIVEPFTLEEYKLLHELEVCMATDSVEDFFIRARVYNLVISYFTKIIKRSETPVIQTSVQYDQLIAAEKLIMENIKSTPAIGNIARKVNMSVPTLARKFKLVHEQSIYEYYISKKLELARKMIIELGVPIKKIAEIIG